MGLVLLHQNLVYISTYPSCYQPCHWCVKWIVPPWWVTSLLNMTPSRTRDSMYSSALAVEDAQLHALFVLLLGVWCCQGLIYQSPPRPCWPACPAPPPGCWPRHDVKVQMCISPIIFLLWMEQMEGIWYQHTPDFGAIALGPFTLPLI